MSIYLVGSLRDLDPVYLEALCAIEVLGRMGLSNVQVLQEKVLDVKAALFADQTSPEDTCLCLRVFGSKDGNGKRIVFTMAIGPIGCPAEEFPIRWAKAFETLANAPLIEAESVWKRSRMQHLMPSLAEKLRAKGFSLRALTFCIANDRLARR